MSAELRLYLYNNFWEKGPRGNTGSSSVRLNFSRELLSNLNIFTQIRYDNYFRKSSNPESPRRRFLAYIAPSYTFLKDWSFSPGLSVAWYNLGNSKKSNEIGFAPEVGYAFTKDFSMGLYWDSTPFASNDGRFFAPGIGKNSVFATYLSYSLF